MPRKNARPAAKKAAKRRAERVAKKAAPSRHTPPQDMAMHGVAIAALAASVARSFDMKRDPEIDRAIGDNFDDLYES
jgi:hypothetical protein